jgi:hypothetical protein
MIDDRDVYLIVYLGLSEDLLDVLEEIYLNDLVSSVSELAKLESNLRDIIRNTCLLNQHVTDLRLKPFNIAFVQNYIYDC